MPQLDLYNFFLIVFFAVMGILIFFIFFHKNWLYSWKLVTVIGSYIKNITNTFQSLFSKILLVLLSSFFFFNNIICIFFYNFHLTLQQSILIDFSTILDCNQLKNFNN